MDRFIEIPGKSKSSYIDNLKSNMDRFIGLEDLPVILAKIYLKSNMDRFIEDTTVNVNSLRLI